MNQAWPPVGPKGQNYQANLVGSQYRLRRDVRPKLNGQVNWQMRVSSPAPVQLTGNSQHIYLSVKN
ncbi:MAG: hypothetical protein QGI86_09395 [Candidatus Poribacteria bacterium]|nr:hypothetical protein [Candidatus Poribacteria bacterium]MDP6748298.1 hypothetical protein [Candidatus Poribacteria bacterium]MDP6994914.1 hypothetical protein [Candidatus Poribacteria bacterium]